MFLLVLSLTVFGCNEGPPVDVAGQWSGGYDITAAITPCTLNLKQKGGTITGSYSAFEAASQTGLSGELTGTVKGPKVHLELDVPDDVKEEQGWSDLTMDLVLREEDGEPALGGWTKRMDGDQKRVMETLLTVEEMREE